MRKLETRPEEQSLWQEHIAVIRSALDQGKPDAIINAKAEIRRLETEIVAAMSRASIQDGAGVDSSMLTARVLELTARVEDIRKLLDTLKLIPRETDEGPTPEVAARPALRDPIVLLEEDERKAPGTGLTSDQARAAKEIAWVSEGITRVGKARVANMESSGMADGYREPEMPSRLAEVHSTRYLPWASWHHDNDPVTLDICVKVGVYGLPLKALARKHRTRRSNALDRLQRGLERYWDRKLLDIYLDKTGR